MTSPDQTQASAATLRRALQAIEQMQNRLAQARAKLERYEHARTEPIAIIGVGCRLPGGVVDADTYWRLLRAGTDAVRDVPADRWDVDAIHNGRPQRPGTTITRNGGFLDRIDLFDHEFFGISRAEAADMDPQQRLALQVAWEALENAGQAPAGLAGSRTGVFAAVCTNDFAVTNFRHPADVTAYTATGTAHSAVPGRICYALDLRGPAIAVDTACSSSLVALHLACQSLRAGECDLALAGGVNIIMSPMTSMAFSQFPGMVSPDGACRSFDAGANGSIFSEGCGFVVIKRLSDAVRDDDQVLALVRGAAVNQNGRGSALTAPSGLAQRDVLRRALEAGGVTEGEVSYIEVHGSGTPLGDSIEAEALAEVYGRDQGQPVYLGTAKTNIGHLQAAAGIAALIKVVLAMNHEAIPPNLHFHRLNPDISFGGTTFTVPTELTKWPRRGGGRRIAGVSSFGFTGTNAHVIVEEAPVRGRPRTGDRRPLSVLALSARTDRALVDLAKRYAGRLAGDDAPVADICFSANAGRSHFANRLAAVGGTGQEIAGLLTRFVEGVPGDGPATGRAGNAEVAFLFTGQGAQRPGMARELYQTQPTFRREIDRCDAVLRPILGTSLPPAAEPDGQQSALLARPAYADPALFAVEYALARLWQSWGVEPVAVLGHGLGEYVAACVAGVMSLEDGLGLVAERGRLLGTLTGTTAVVDPVLPALRRAAEAVTFAAPRIPLVSNVTGELWPWNRTPQADYWCRHARQPVRFADGVATLRAMGCRNFLEVGPAPILLGLISDAGPVEGDGLLLPSLRPEDDDWPVLLSAVARLYVHGAGIDWAAFDSDYERSKLFVPTYPFEPTRCWRDAGAGAAARGSNGWSAGAAGQARLLGEPDTQTPEEKRCQPST